MQHTFRPGTMLVDRQTGEAYLVVEGFTMTRLSEFHICREVSTWESKTIRVDLSRLLEDFEIYEPPDVSS